MDKLEKYIEELKELNKDAAETSIPMFISLKMYANAFECQTVVEAVENIITDLIRINEEISEDRSI